MSPEFQIRITDNIIYDPDHDKEVFPFTNRSEAIAEYNRLLEEEAYPGCLIELIEVLDQHIFPEET